jgi:hypothetical protein
VCNVVETWRARISTEDLLNARERVALAALRRMLGPVDSAMESVAEIVAALAAQLPGEGKCLFAGLKSIPFRQEPMFDLWHAANMYREHRGDSHIASWSSRGLSPVEACLINDLNQGFPLKSYVRTRGWSDDEIDDGANLLRQKGLVTGGRLSRRGRRLRAEIEAATDAQQATVVKAMSSELRDSIEVLTRYRGQILAQRGYPRRADLASVRRWES